MVLQLHEMFWKCFDRFIFITFTKIPSNERKCIKSTQLNNFTDNFICDLGTKKLAHWQRNMSNKFHYLKHQVRLYVLDCHFAWKCCNLPFLIDGTWFIACWVSFGILAKIVRECNFSICYYPCKFLENFLWYLEDFTVNSIMKLRAK